MKQTRNLSFHVALASYKRFHTMDSIKYTLTEGFLLSPGFAFQRKKNVTEPQKNLPLLNALQNHALRFPLFVSTSAA